MWRTFWISFREAFSFIQSLGATVPLGFERAHLLSHIYQKDFLNSECCPQRGSLMPGVKRIQNYPLCYKQKMLRKSIQPVGVGRGKQTDIQIHSLYHQRIHFIWIKRWTVGSRGQMGERCQKVQTFSCKISKSWGFNIRFGKYSYYYSIAYLKVARRDLKTSQHRKNFAIVYGDRC